MKLPNLAKPLALIFAIAVAAQSPAQNAEEIPTDGLNNQIVNNEDELPPFDDYLPEPPPPAAEMPQDAPYIAPSGEPTGAPLPQEIPVVQPDIEEAAGAYQLTDAGLNDVFQLLAENANRQYFHNPRIASDEFRVTGRLMVGDPLGKMEELAFQYGLEIYEKGNTVYALTKDQMGELPSKEWHYRLRYLRPKDIAGIKEMVVPYLSPGTGIVNYEPKTNTVVVIDTPQRIERVESFFRTVDRPLNQIVVEVKILSVNSTAASNLGTNWASTLGASGISLNSIYNLNSIFGIQGNNGGTGDGNFTLSPVELSGVLSALNEGGLVKQMSNPVIVTEDAEQAIISLIDRFPIVTRTVNAGNGITTTTEEVRYILDEGDQVGDPATTREIGITMAVTPQLLDDGTIRMEMRPRSAQVVDQIEGIDGNLYPRVSESTIMTTARIPDGHSLIIGGFFNEVESDNGTKIPILGDIPILNFLFKNNSRAKETASLIFVVTPTSYSPEDSISNARQSARIREKLLIKKGHESINPQAPGAAHEADYCRTMQAIQRGLGRQTRGR